MAGSSSASRRPARTTGGGGISAVLPYLLVAAGVALVALSVWTEWSGKVHLSQTLYPDRSGDGTTYTADTVELEPGQYGLRLSVRRVRVMLSVAGGVGFSVTAKEHPGWIERGRFKLREGRSTSRDDAFASDVISVPAPGPATLTIAVKEDFSEPLSLQLRAARADFRIALYLGLGLAGAGCAMHRPLRDKLIALAART